MTGLSMGGYIAGLDGGGTKVLCLLADLSGRVLGAGRGGPINTNFVPEEVARACMRDAFSAAITAAGLSPGLPLRCLAHAGPVPQRLVLEEAEGLFELPRAQGGIVLLGEGEAAIETMQPWLEIPVAVAVDSGTGSIASGRDCAGRWAHAGGWGALLGDEGSGYWIGLRAMQAAVRASDGRERPTKLTELVLSHFAIDELHQLIPLVYRGPVGRREIASLAPAVAKAARDGDEVAREIMVAAAKELALLAQAVIARLHLESEEFAVVTFGSVFRAYDLLGPIFEKLVWELAPRARFVSCRYEPVVGCLVAALRKAGIPLTETRRDLLFGTAAQALAALGLVAGQGQTSDLYLQGGLRQ